MARRNQTLVAGAVAVVLVGLIAGVAAALLGTSHRRASQASLPATTEAGHFPKRTAGFTPIAPLTDTPAETPVQEQYDAALASGLASSSSVKIAVRAQAPAPAFSSSWPPVLVANTPEQWVTDFTAELLDIDFARQSWAGLGAWLSAEEAPELLPGVPQQIQDKVLFLSLFDASALGGASPIPDDSTWDAYARSGVRWSVSDVLVQADPTFSQIIASGWEPIDQRFAAEDVSGVLTVTVGHSATRRHFSMAVYVGSAHWHPGYGTVLVNAWKET
jgi:hypothetical protein